MIFGWGVFYIYGVFFTPLEQEFHWTRAATSGAFSFSVLMSGVAGVIAGRLSDRLGPRVVITFCAVLLAAGYCLMSIIHNLGQFYLVYGLLIATGVGGFWSPPVSTVARWFSGQRGLMTGIVSSGISFGTLLLPPLVTQLISIYNWRATYLIIGGAVLVVVIVSARFLKSGPQSSQTKFVAGEKARLGAGRAGYTLKEAWRTRQFWLVAAVYLLFGFVQLTVMVHIVPAATGMGFSAIRAATVLSIIGGASLVGRIIIGIISDKVRIKLATVICLSLLTAAMILLQFAGSPGKMDAFAAVFGFGYGGLSCLQSLIAAELYGLTALGVITAIFSFSFNIGGAIGPVMAGYLFDVTQSYHWAFLLCLLAIIAALLFFIPLKSPRRR